LSKHAQFTSRRSFRISAGVGALAVAIAAVGTGAAFADEAPAKTAAAVPADAAAAAAEQAAAGHLPVPPDLVPPVGNVASAVFSATGVQIYKCTTTAGVAAWAFVEPVATLTGTTLNSRKRTTAVHYRGPSWQSDQDGSLIVGKAVANSPVSGSIPQLLVQAVSNQGTGVFGQATYVQRLATSGGAAPAGACTDGTITSVPYRAVYKFFVKG
jgi:hypothetical protein